VSILELWLSYAPDLVEFSRKLSDNLKQPTCCDIPFWWNCMSGILTDSFNFSSVTLLMTLEMAHIPQCMIIKKFGGSSFPITKNKNYTDISSECMYGILTDSFKFSYVTLLMTLEMARIPQCMIIKKFGGSSFPITKNKNYWHFFRKSFFIWTNLFRLKTLLLHAFFSETRMHWRF